VEPRFSVRDCEATPIQMPPESVAAIEQLPAHQLHWVRQPAFLSEHIGITGPIPRETAYEDTGGPFFKDANGSMADPIDDDLALWIRNDDGIVVCVGCSHAGIINIMNHVRRLNNDQKIRAIIGGFHLLNASAERLDRTITAMRQRTPDSIMPCHCTGDTATELLVEAFGERCSPGSAGMVFEF
ncbi:MAG TPA: MBL fold metallo-hydrolase, partial [Spirochaetia bacterium]|nr:MBL fold metallo-hydrolase [Spirochaetia bacterium]